MQRTFYRFFTRFGGSWTLEQSSFNDVESFKLRIQCFTYVLLFVAARSPSKCPNSWPYLWGWFQTPCGGNSFQPFASTISFFLSLSKARGYRWGLEHRSTGKSSPLRSATPTVRYNNTRLTADAAPISLSSNVARKTCSMEPESAL